ncbi:MAG: peptidoglycan DD-metalloendopeptidase family protein [Sphingomonas adhaesiva]|uniref:murein hydrolase activator EnvC family protein n=1 Tax=Sphingomonas adhaesiva TaxID=28212 RepID=UPI002FF6B2C2
MTRGRLLLAAAVASVASAAAWAAATAATGDDLRGAKAAVLIAQRQARAFDARADAATDPAERARWQEQAVAARVAAAEAEIAAGRTRAALIGALLSEQRRALAAQQAPIAAALESLVTLARRPALVTLVRPGSVSDLVHVQAVLATTLPALRERTATLRAQVARTRTLQDNAETAARALEDGRGRLVEAREQLAALRGAVGDGDERALALGEVARDTGERLARIGGEQAVLGDVIALPGPPAAAPPAAVADAPAYRLPVRGRLVTGLGEVSGDGVRARGLTFAVAPGAAMVAPAAGRIAYARPFRSYGGVVIVDHGAGWTTLLTGLGTLSVRPGQTVAAGAPIGRAAVNDGAQVTVELRRLGRPMDIARLVG